MLHPLPLHYLPLRGSAISYLKPQSPNQHFTLCSGYEFGKRIAPAAPGLAADLTAALVAQASGRLPWHLVCGVAADVARWLVKGGLS